MNLRNKRDQKTFLSSRQKKRRNESVDDTSNQIRTHAFKMCKYRKVNVMCRTKPKNEQELDERRHLKRFAFETNTT